MRQQRVQMGSKKIFLIKNEGFKFKTNSESELEITLGFICVLYQEEYKLSSFQWFIISFYYSLNIAGTGTGSQPYAGFVENSGIRIHYRAAGQGPLLLLLHGFADNEETFKAQMVDFSKKYTVSCPTLRGLPPSDVLDDVDAYDLSHVVGDMVTIIGHFKAEKAIIGGYDFGGAAIQMLAMMAPDRIAGLILINTPTVPMFYDLVNFDEGQQKMSEYTIKFMEYQPGDEKNEADVVKFIRDPSRRQAVQEYMRTYPMHGTFAYYKKNYPAPPLWEETNWLEIVLILSYMQPHFLSLKYRGVTD
ncbi:hypothetical protein ETB97_012177 [Aspergillus alliaceus]|uniref:AB hydrolase-1 domain-containing protein n=1 Tax=Petromyces alliaceus TaxID=209559 RepID=A0A8H6A569_PETAA|nr:hypothetical protein ETB97_012177 [Aspergillus burnettii]